MIWRDGVVALEVRYRAQMGVTTLMLHTFTVERGAAGDAVAFCYMYISPLLPVTSRSHLVPGNNLLIRFVTGTIVLILLPVTFVESIYI